MPARHAVAPLLAACLALAPMGAATARTVAKPAAPAQVQAHPLQALSGAEITKASGILRKHAAFPADGIFPILDLLEPSKAELAAWTPGAKLARKVHAVVYSRAAKMAYEADVDLTAGTVLRWGTAPGMQPMVLMEEYDIAGKAVRADARWQAAMRKRGITDFEKVGVDGWAAGPAFGTDRRVLRALSFYKGENKNYYNRPIEGVLALVDLDTKQVLQVTDTGVKPLAERGWDYDVKSTRGKRQAPRPLVVSQPQGPSFTVENGEVRWQNWRFRFAVHARDGLVLRQVGYEEDGKVRSILYRAAVSEMIVPYGDPDPNWNWRAAFDVGEYGFGNLGSPLELGGDVPATAKLFDAVFVDPQGKPYEFAKAGALYERDGGVLWKHYDYISGINNVRRARQLVLSTAATIGNYDYLINWVFHQDGTLEFDAAATGILLAKGTDRTKGEARACPGCTGHLVDKHVEAPNHQHFFNFRLDFDVDGPKNSIYEMNQASLGPGHHNPNGNAFSMAETPLMTEAAAQRDLNPESNRRWRIVNPHVTNGLGNLSGYMLAPGDSTPAYVTKDAPARKRARFLDHAFWGTRFKADELYSSGDFPNQAGQDRGLAKWSDGEGLVDEDLVVWYTMGLSHAPREEEWPMMNSHHLGFKIMPCGFFTRNPALDVPR